MTPIETMAEAVAKSATSLLFIMCGNHSEVHLRRDEVETLLQGTIEFSIRAYLRHEIQRNESQIRTLDVWA
jgi:hypothetical protein